MFKNFTNTRVMNEFAGVEAGTASHDVNTIALDPNETFEDMDYVSESSKKIGEEHAVKFKEKIERVKGSKNETDEKEVKEAKSKKGNDLDVVDMDKRDKEEDEKDDKEDKQSKKEDKKSEAKSKKDKDLEDKEDGDEEGKEESEIKADKEAAKKLKIRMSDGLYGIEPDAKVRVKIDGNFEEVPVQELINQYSGKVAYDKKFSELGMKNKEVEQLVQQNQKQAEFFTEVANKVIGVLQDKTRDPREALNFIVEKSGMDPYDVWKRTLESNLDEVENLMSMSELERENYFLKKQTEFRTKSEENRKAESAKEAAFNQAIQKVDSLRQAHGVSEEQYLQALDELETQGVDTNKLSDEQVVDYASLKPHVEAVQDVLEPYESVIDDSKYSKVVQNLARQIRAKDFTKEQLAEWAKKEFMDEDLKDLQARTKEAPKAKSKVEVKAPTKLETLDFDDEE
jgi:hypothetical protein